MLGFSSLQGRAKNTLLGLLAAGFVLNCLPVALLPSLEFLFGSIAVLVVVHLFGAAWGTLAGVVAGLYTVHLWGHPYGLMLLAAEALFIGLLRGKSRNMLLLDGIFWLLIGMPLAWLFYSRFLHAPPSTVRLIMLKDAVNGIFNALAASLLVMYQPLGREALPILSGIDAVQAKVRNTPRDANLASGRMSLSQVIFNLSVGCALVPALLLTITSARQTRNTIESDLQSTLRQQSAATARSMALWRNRRVSLAREMADGAARAQLQPTPALRHDTTLITKPYADLLAVRLVTFKGAPSVSTTGIASQNLLYSRPNTRQQAQAPFQNPNAILLRKLKTARLPFFGSVAATNSTIATSRTRDVVSRGVDAAQSDILYAPIRRGGVMRGFLAIRIDSARLQERISRSVSNAAFAAAPIGAGAQARVALIDSENRLVAGSYADGSMPRSSSIDAAPRRVSSSSGVNSDSVVQSARPGVDRFAPGRRGRVKTFADGVYVWSPQLAMPLVESARHSVFVRETPLEGLPWTLVVSSALEPQLSPLRSSSFDNLLLMLILSIASLILAQVLSMSLTRPLSRLAEVTTDLPLKLIGPQKPDVLWPDTPLEEMDALVRNFKSMSGTLQENFRQIQNARRRLEEEQARLKEANRLKDEFLAILSHELRTPLVPIIGYADLISRGALQGEETIEAAQAIERNARVQLRLIEDLLDVSRIISGKMRLEIGPLHLEAIVHDALDTVHHAAQDKDIHLALRAQDKLPVFYGDPARLKQILWNLLSNAVKFTPPGGRIDVSLDHIGGNARLSVADSGQGISSEFLPFIFDRFRQAGEHLTRAHGGLGLGLAIVRHLVEAHGGHIEARSEGEGKGTAFLITLPFKAPPDTPAADVATAALSHAALAPHMSTQAAPEKQTIHAQTPDAQNATRKLQDASTASEETRLATAQNGVSQPIAAKTLDAETLDAETLDASIVDERKDAAMVGDGQGDDAGSAAEQSRDERMPSQARSNGDRSQGERAFVDDSMNGSEVGADVNEAVERAALELEARLGMEPHLNGAADRDEVEDMHRGIGRLRGARVLVVDDEAENRGLLGTIIRLEGGEVTDAASGGEGLLMAQRATPSVIVSDIGMPVMDGYEFLQKLRAVEALKDVPVVAFTAYADGRDRVRSLQNGFNAYLSKPAQADDVIEVIESLFQRHGD